MGRHSVLIFCAVLLTMIAMSEESTSRFCLWQGDTCGNNNAFGPRGYTLACSLRFRGRKCQTRGNNCWCLVDRDILMQKGEEEEND